MHLSLVKFTRFIELFVRDQFELRCYQLQFGGEPFCFKFSFLKFSFSKFSSFKFSLLKFSSFKFSSFEFNSFNDKNAEKKLFSRQSMPIQTTSRSSAECLSYLLWNYFPVQTWFFIQRIPELISVQLKVFWHSPFTNNSNELQKNDYFQVKMEIEWWRVGD